MSSKLKNIFIYCAIGLFVLGAIVCVCCSVFIKPNNSNELTISCQESVEIYVDESYDLPITCSNENAIITLKSANTNIVEINNLTLVSKAVGSTNVRVTANVSGKTVGTNVKVTIKNKIEDLGMNLSENITLYLLDKQKNLAYENGYMDFVTYSSSYPVNYSLTNEDVVSIKNNKISALALGETTLTFHSVENPNITFSTHINITKFDPTLNIDMDDQVFVKIGHNLNLSYNISPKYYYGLAEINTFVDEENIAIIDDGKIVPKTIGQTNLNFYLNDNFVKSIEINVVNDDSVIITPPEEDEPIHDPPEIPDEPSPSTNYYDFAIIPLSRCSAEGNTITINNVNATFRIEIHNGENLVNATNPVISDSSIISIPGGSFMIQKFESFSFTISYESLDLVVSINVIKN